MNRKIFGRLFVIFALFFGLSQLSAQLLSETVKRQLATIDQWVSQQGLAHFIQNASDAQKSKLAEEAALLRDQAERESSGSNRVNHEKNNARIANLNNLLELLK